MACPEAPDSAGERAPAERVPEQQEACETLEVEGLAEAGVMAKRVDAGADENDLAICPVVHG
jgi:hypothetical protein